MRPLTLLACGLLLGLGAATLQGAQAPAPGQVAPQIEQCLHGKGESAAEKERRTEALAAMRMIDHVVSRAVTLHPTQMTWERLAGHFAVRELQGMDGRVGELANKIVWGDREPLPGWRIAWVSMPPNLQSPMAILFSLTDDRDTCRFKYSSTDPDVSQPGRGGVRLLPLESP